MKNQPRYHRGAAVAVLAAIGLFTAARGSAVEPLKMLQDDYTTVVKQLRERAKALVKSEYETTAQYEARKEGFTAKYPDLLKPRTFVFSNEILYRKWKRLSHYEYIQYQADEQRVSVRLSPDDTDTISPGFKVYRLDEKITPLGTYVGSNAYGAKVRIKKENVHWPCLAIMTSFVPPKELLFEYKGRFNASRKPELAIAVTGVLEEPFLFESTTYHEPVFDSPFDQKYTEACVAMMPQRFVLFDVKTGEILGTIDMPRDDRTAD
jgi:hypothetical protein